MIDAQQMTERIPAVRITASLRERLESIAGAHKLTTSLSDHIRFALEKYVESEEAKAQTAADLTSRIN